MQKEIFVGYLAIVFALIGILSLFFVNSIQYGRTEVVNNSIDVITNIYLGEHRGVRLEKATIVDLIGFDSIYKGVVPNFNNKTELSARFYFDNNENRYKVFFYTGDNPVLGENCNPETFFFSLEGGKLNNIENAIFLVDTELPIHVYFTNVDSMTVARTNLSSCIAGWGYACTRKELLEEPISFRNKIYGYLFYGNTNIDLDFNVTNIRNTNACINVKKQFMSEEKSIDYCSNNKFLSKTLSEGTKEINLYINDILIHTIVIKFDRDIAKGVCEI